MSKELMMQKFLLNHGWIKHGATGWVKNEWQDELNKLGENAKFSPNWYRNESIDDAYIMAKIDSTIIETTIKINNNIKLLLENIIISSINDDNWDDVRDTVKDFTKKTLYDWYLDVSLNKPNSIISEEFNIVTKKK